VDERDCWPCLGDNGENFVEHVFIRCNVLPTNSGIGLASRFLVKVGYAVRAGRTSRTVRSKSTSW
jgi:hypothetical protein